MKAIRESSLHYFKGTDSTTNSCSNIQVGNRDWDFWVGNFFWRIFLASLVAARMIHSAEI